MRWFLAAAMTMLIGCSGAHAKCEDLPMISDWGEGQELQAVPVGSEVAFGFPFNEGQSPDCIDVRTVPSFPVTVTADGQVKFVPTAAGIHQVTVQSSTGKGPSYSARVMAETPPPVLQPCVVLPQSCTRVFDVPGFVACDQSLFDLSGRTVATLDGGDWFGSGGALFAWEEGVLRRMAVTDAGVTELASSSALRPRLWAGGAGRLAIGTADGGAVFDLSGQGLVPQSEFPLAASTQALALTTTGAILTASGGVADFACMVGVGCTRDRYSPNAAPALLAANETGVFVRIQRTFFGVGDPVKFSVELDGGFTASNFATLVGTERIVNAGEQVPRREHVASIWGMRVDGVDGAMNLADATKWSSTDGVVWASSPTQTAIWCAPR